MTLATRVVAVASAHTSYLHWSCHIPTTSRRFVIDLTMHASPLPTGGDPPLPPPTTADTFAALPAGLMSVDDKEGLTLRDPSHLSPTHHRFLRKSLLSLTATPSKTPIAHSDAVAMSPSARHKRLRIAARQLASQYRTPHPLCDATDLEMSHFMKACVTDLTNGLTANTFVSTDGGDKKDADNSDSAVRRRRGPTAGDLDDGVRIMIEGFLLGPHRRLMQHADRLALLIYYGDTVQESRGDTSHDCVSVTMPPLHRPGVSLMTQPLSEVIASPSPPLQLLSQECISALITDATSTVKGRFAAQSSPAPSLALRELEQLTVAFHVIATTSSWNLDRVAAMWLPAMTMALLQHRRRAEGQQEPHASVLEQCMSRLLDSGLHCSRLIRPSMNALSSLILLLPDWLSSPASFANQATPSVTGMTACIVDDAAPLARAPNSLLTWTDEDRDNLTTPMNANPGLPQARPHFRSPADADLMLRVIHHCRATLARSYKAPVNAIAAALLRQPPWGVRHPPEFDVIAFVSLVRSFRKLQEGATVATLTLRHLSTLTEILRRAVPMTSTDRTRGVATTLWVELVAVVSSSCDDEPVLGTQLVTGPLTDYAVAVKQSYLQDFDLWLSVDRPDDSKVAATYRGGDFAPSKRGSARDRYSKAAWHADAGISAHRASQREPYRLTRVSDVVTALRLAFLTGATWDRMGFWEQAAAYWLSKPHRGVTMTVDSAALWPLLQAVSLFVMTTKRRRDRSSLSRHLIVDHVAGIEDHRQGTLNRSRCLAGDNRVQQQPMDRPAHENDKECPRPADEHALAPLGLPEPVPFDHPVSPDAEKVLHLGITSFLSLFDAEANMDHLERSEVQARHGGAKYIYSQLIKLLAMTGLEHASAEQRLLAYLRDNKRAEKNYRRSMKEDVLAMHFVREHGAPDYAALSTACDRLRRSLLPFLPTKQTLNVPYCSDDASAGVPPGAVDDGDDVDDEGSADERIAAAAVAITAKVNKDERRRSAVAPLLTAFAVLVICTSNDGSDIVMGRELFVDCASAVLAAGPMRVASPTLLRVLSDAHRLAGFTTLDSRDVGVRAQSMLDSL